MRALLLGMATLCTPLLLGVDCTTVNPCEFGLGAPTASAGADRNALVGDRVDLSGLASTDADGDTLTYQWQQNLGPAVALADANSPLARFMVQEEGTYGFTLTVSDACNSDEDTVLVTVGEEADDSCPRASAGIDKSVNENTESCLSGAGSADPNGSALTFDWVQLDGPQVTLSNPFVENPCFSVGDIEGDQELLFELTVTNESDCANADTVAVSVRDLDDPVTDPVRPCQSDAACDDRNRCTVDACQSGACTHEPVECASGSDCDTATGQCVSQPTPLPCASCDDQDACTEDQCINNACTHTPIVCDDANPCTQDGCDSSSGCVYRLPDCITGGLCNAATGHLYQRVNGDWPQAQEEAERIGGTLVVINDQAEQNWLAEQFGGRDWYWIGFTDEGSENAWRWVTGEPATFTNWFSGEPNNQYAGGEHFGVMNWSDSGAWNDLGPDSNEWNDVGVGIAEIDLAAACPPPCRGNADCSSGLVCRQGWCGRNLPPVAIGPAERSVDGGVEITLDGSRSFDPEGAELSFAWRQIAGQSIELRNPAGSIASLTTPSVTQPAELKFELIVSDGTLSSSPFVVTIRVKPAGCRGPLAFSTESFETGGWAPIGITLAHVDGDGVLDVLVGNASDHRDGIERTNLSILFGRGDGRLGPPRTYYSGHRANRVDTGDVDKDGFTDVVVSNFGEGTITLFYGTSTGVLADSRTTEIEVGGSPRDVELADLNDDGSLDIIVANAPSNALSILLNSGTGTFGPIQTLTTNSQGDGPGDVIVADLNEDGCPDVATTIVGRHVSNVVRQLFGFCDGTFSAPTSITVGTNPDGMATGDFDADGNLDLVVGNSQDWTVSVVFGDGLGGFPTAVVIDDASGVNGIAVGDINGDAIDDVVAAVSEANGVMVLISSGDGSFQESYFRAGTAPSRVALGDLDGDKDLDIVVTNFEYAGKVTVLLNRCGE